MNSTNNPNLPVGGGFKLNIMDELAPAVQQLRDVGLQVAGLFVGHYVTHFKTKVITNDMGDKQYIIKETLNNVNVIIQFPAEAPIVKGVGSEYLEDLLPITMLSQFSQEFEIGDIIEVYRKDIYGHITTEKYELMTQTSLKLQSELHRSFTLAPFRQDLKDEDKDFLKPEETDPIMEVSDNDKVDDPIIDTDMITNNDDILIPKKNRDSVDPYDEL